MRFVWDERKRRSNQRKHGVDFAELPRIFQGAIVTVVDDRFDYQEFRFVTFGRLDATVVAVAHTETEEEIRIISARKATRHEQESYFAKTQP